MRNLFLIKVLFGLPLVLLADYLIMVVLGCVSCLFGLGNDFYCGPYCLIGKGVLLLSAGLFLFMIFPDIKQLLKHKKNAQAD